MIARPISQGVNAMAPNAMTQAYASMRHMLCLYEDLMLWLKHGMALTKQVKHVMAPNAMAQAWHGTN